MQNYGDSVKSTVIKQRKVLTKWEQKTGKKHNFADKMETQLIHLQSQDVYTRPHAAGHGALMMCRKGSATATVNGSAWQLRSGIAFIFFPSDIVDWTVSPDFEADVLRYSQDILRSVSVNIEHEVYLELRNDRLSHAEPQVTGVIDSIFNILEFYFNDPYTPSISRIVALQVQSFFIGFADYIRFNPRSHSAQSNDSQRNQQLFAQFMKLISEHYRECHEVTAYAQMMNISRKYLSRVSNEHTGLSPKRIINDYIVEQLKLTLYNTSKSLKEIAAEFHFADQSALTRYFKQHCGTTPKNYLAQALPSTDGRMTGKAL